MNLGKFIHTRTGTVLLGTGALLLFGGIGGATAAEMITSQDIKDHTIQGRDIHQGAVGSPHVHDGSLALRDLNDNARSRINRPGPQGPAGPAGADGKDGTNAYDTLPSGRTVYGAIGGDYDTQAAPGTADWGIDASLPMRAPQGLTDADVEVNTQSWQDAGGQTPPTSGDNGNTTCTGTADNPTAPAGTVCIYVTGADNAANVSGDSVAFGSGSSPYGFKMVWDTTGTGDTFVDAVWAYTAP